MARWLASFSDLELIVLIEDPPSQVRQRFRAEIRRSGWLGLLDALAFRIWFRFTGAKKEARWEARQLQELRQRFPSLPSDCKLIHTDSPNHPDVESTIKEISPDFGIARCKRLIAKRIFSIPRLGVFVIHPGICPEYRNAHGCFWAIINEDYENVGATLLKIDSGIDTGPVLEYFRIQYDPLEESHLRIQNRVVLEHLDTIASLITEAHETEILPIDTSLRSSGLWGQPRLSRFLRWRRRYRRNQNTLA